MAGGPGIRLRITATAVAAAAIVLLAVSAAVVALQRQALAGALDEALTDRVEDVVAAWRKGRLPARITPATGEEVAQVVGPDGRIVAATRNLRNSPALPVSVPPAGGTATDLRIGDDDVRLLSRAVPGLGDVHVGTDAGAARESTAALVRALAITVPLAVAALGILTWWLVGRALRPVETIRAEVSEIESSDLGRRVPQPGTNDELDRLAVTMNEMLARLEHSAAGQQRFVADASHELRSPLARLRTLLEVELASNPHPADVTRQALDDVIGMQRIVTDLLHLARADAGELITAREPVDLDDIVLREVRRMRDECGLTIDVSRVSGAHVRGDAAQLTAAVRNLTDNAQRHARSTIRLSLGEQDGEAVLVVRDDGSGVPATDAERIFDRFARVDAARAPDGGVGLGLAITRDIATRHGGRVTLLPDGPGAAFELRLPTA